MQCAHNRKMVRNGGAALVGPAVGPVVVPLVVPLVVVATLLLGGCEAPPQRQAAPVPGGTWDAVLPTPVTVAAGEDYSGGEYYRNDARLAATGNPYPLNEWPAEPTPSAFYWRTLSMPSSANSTLLFRQRYTEYGTYNGAYQPRSSYSVRP